MPSCPNCGRQTLRTIDWACQWCGYPLVSRAFKKIDKTFKEIQAERSLSSKSAQSEEEPEVEPEEYPAESEPEPEQELKPRPKIPVKPVYQPFPEPKPEPLPETKPKPVSEAVSKPVEPPTPPKSEQPVIQLPPPEPKPASPPRAEVAPSSEPLITPPPLPKQELPPTPRPEIKIQPEPPPVTAIKLEEIRDGMEITADQIDALFKADKSAANAKFAGKTLVIHGIVEKVFVREHLEIRYIMLTGVQKKLTWSLRCAFDKDESAKLTRLDEGQAVALRCKYDGYSKNIIFKDCVLL